MKGKGEPIKAKEIRAKDLNAQPRLRFETLEKIANGIVHAIPEVVSVTYNITSKPPSTIEAI